MACEPCDNRWRVPGGSKPLRTAMPPKRFASPTDFQPAGIDIAAFEDVEEVWRSIIADNTHEPDGSEKRCGVGEVNGAAAEDVIASAEGGFDGVDADGAGD